jgi:hypothetical protein
VFSLFVVNVTATENTTEAEMTAGNHLGKALAMLASPFHKEPWLSF